MLTIIQAFSGQPRVAFLVIIAYLIAVVSAIILHELGHGYAAYICGDETAKMRGRLSLNPVKHLDPIGFLMMVVVGFGWAKPVPIDPRNFKSYKRDMIFTSLAGVLMNFLVAFIAAAILAIFVAVTKNSDMTYVTNGVYSAGNYFYVFMMYTLVYSIIFNATLIAFNILPIYPLDGFRIVETLAKPDNRYVNFMYRYGNFVLLGLLLLSNILGRINSNLDIFSLYISMVRNIVVKLFELMFHITIL